MGARFEMDPNLEQKLTDEVNSKLEPVQRSLHGKSRAEIRAGLEAAGLTNVGDELVDIVERGEIFRVDGNVNLRT